jgi:hypothetical protein
VARVLAAKGRVSVEEYLRIRVRYFTAGGIVGSKEFVNEVFAATRWRYGSTRRDGARRMRGVDSDGLYALRDLQVDVFGPPSHGPPPKTG